MTAGAHNDPQAVNPKQRDAWTARVVPPFEQLAGSVWSIPVECDTFSIRFTYCYAISGAEGRFVLIDPGWASETGRRQLDAGVVAAGLDWSGLEGILVTHFHSDHIGAAQTLADQTGAWLALHRLDADLMARCADAGLAARDIIRWLDECGVPEAARPDIMRACEIQSQLAGGVKATRIIEHDQFLHFADRELQLVWTPGHSPGHLVVADHSSQLLFTGDHVLPRITPNVGLGAHDPDRSPIFQYLDSLERMREFGGFTVAPAHEFRFLGLGERLDQLRKHTLDRVKEVGDTVSAQASPTVWETARRVTWSRGWDRLDGFNLMAALAETNANVYALQDGQGYV